jgi:cell wall-associated NlpC family hydrolase
MMSIRKTLLYGTAILTAVLYQSAYAAPDFSSLDYHPVAEQAKEFIGTRYKWGGMDRSGVDCSGLLVAILKEIGVKPPARVLADFRKLGKVIPVEEVRAGDILFFYNKTGEVKHMGIAINDHYFVHANGLSQKVTVGILYGPNTIRRLAEARRIDFQLPMH